MAKARRVEDAVTFWRNQQSFHLEPTREFTDSVNSNMAAWPSEMRRALASGVIHTVRDDREKKKRRQLQTVFSDDSLPLGEQQKAEVLKADESCGSISFSASE